MPSLPEIPGSAFVKSGGRRAGKLAVGGALAMIAVGGYVARRLIRRGGSGEEEGAATSDPVAQAPTAAPEGAEMPEPEPKDEEPAPLEAADAPEAPAPTTETPPVTGGTDAPPAPESEPGDRSKDEDPHHALNNPVTDDPDPTEWPDPYEKRDDPLDPPDPDNEPFGESPHVPPGAESTSQPHPDQDIEAGERAEPPKRDKLDE